MRAELHSHYSFSKWLYLLLLCSGAFTVFSFAPFNLYPLAWITPAVLFYVLTKANTKKQYFLSGWIFGIGLYGAGTSWPFFSMYYFAHAPLVLAVVGTFLFITIIALLTTGIFGLLASLFRHKSVLSKLLLFYPSLWVIVEWSRSWLFTGFPWLYVGNTQIDTIFSAYAPVMGVLGVSLSTVIISGALVSFFFGKSLEVDHDIKPLVNEESARLEKSFNLFAKMVPVLAVSLLIIVAYILNNIEWTQKTGNTLTVSVLQSNISQNEKLDPKNLDPSIKLYQEMTKKSHKSDLIVWPETGLFDAFNSHMDDVVIPLQQSLVKENQSILIGGFNINKENNVENSVLALSKDSRQIYSKRHLVPFGEYIPLLDYIRWLGKWIQLPYSNLVAGQGDGLLQVAGQTAQMTICYEDVFGSEIIQSLPQASMLINLTHDGWFTGSFEPAQHMQIARMRSLETGRYMVRATTNGPSGIIDEKGKLITTAPIYTKRIITGKLQPFSGATPYVILGDWLIIGLLSLISLAGFFLKKPIRVKRK